jgi:hypothetical protein
MRRQACAITMPAGKSSMPWAHESTPTPANARFVAAVERLADAAPHS